MTSKKDGIVLLSKQSGITSFSSLWQIKNALGTKKIGHTGTLDTFAEGLLVVLSGRLTRLVSYITDCDKEYLALISFGSETDTLDPDGTVIKTGVLPTLATLESVIPSFLGPIMQLPPLFSAIHVAGKRASDRIRDGEHVTLPLRPVTIHSIELIDAKVSDGSKSGPLSPVSTITVKIECSKGTYIRSLARDIASAAGSCAYLSSLRRTRIGPYNLEDAAGFSLLSLFGSKPSAVYGIGVKPPQADAEEIISCLQEFTPSSALSVGLQSIFLDIGHLEDFLKGKTISTSWFIGPDQFTDPAFKAAVFCADRFIGLIKMANQKLRYEFVAGNDT